MLSALLNRFRGRESAPSTDRLPRDLVLAIERATVAARGDLDDEGDSRILIHAASLGSFYYHGQKPAAERIARHWPNLSPACCRRAARLLADTIAQRNRAEFRGDRGWRGGWVFDWSRP